MFPSILLHRLERILFPAHVIGSNDVEELVDLLADFEQMHRRIAGSRMSVSLSTPQAIIQRDFSTHPSMSVMRDTWLNSLVPGKMGRPKNSSTTIHPSDHMSIAAEYGSPSRTSGDR
jgi:hypothetical protein